MFAKKKLHYSWAGLCLIAGLAYLASYIYAISPYWFNPQWTTDDALQQVYPFHEVYSPGLYDNDLITEVMVGYLAPLHYWLSYFITWLTGDAIMMSHWLMLIQLGLTLGFFFLFLNKVAGFAPACLGLLWMIHTRTFMQRITGGLPRGWAAAVLAAFLYFLAKKNHKAVLIVLLCGCLTHPPSTVIAALTYGLYLLWGVIKKETRQEFLKPLIVLVLLSPLYIAITYSVVQRPDHIGQMVTYDQAIKLPELNKPHGRFPFLPHTELTKEIRMFAFQPFQHRLSKPPRVIRKNWPYVFLIFLGLLVIWACFRKRKVLPVELVAYLLAVIPIYLLSRPLAFKLYVPDRHLQQPLTLFWIAIVLVVLWKGFARLDKKYFAGPLVIVLTLITAGMVYLGNGHGFYGSSNFNYSLYKKGKVFAWIRKNLPEKSLIAGHPQHIDGLMLFAARKGYATYETAHPFYQKYFKEMLRRHEISLRAHYAKDLKEVYDLLAAEKIDYFIFNKKRFYPDALEKEKYFEPLHGLVRELVSRHYMDFAYKQLPKAVDLNQAPYMLFKDEHSALVDVKLLGEYLSSNV